MKSDRRAAGPTYYRDLTDAETGLDDTDEKEPVLTDVSVEEWIAKQSFKTTKDVEVPQKMSDRVIGQDRAVDVMKKAAAQKRHMMLIGEPGTGKSMLASSMTEYLLPKIGRASCRERV